MIKQGVDYSRTANANWAALASVLKATGKTFVGRYAVNDKSPNGRGITAAEYDAMTAAGIDVYLYWESSEGWMTGGWNAGVAAAVNAQQNINAAGMPRTTPVYFACDFDAAPSHQAAIDDCLRGCAKVLGFERVGVYGGFYVIERCAANKTARWFSQTSAWSGGQWSSHNHIEQYAYNAYFAGTNCDLNRAMQANYGQASMAADPTPAPSPSPLPYVPPAPEPFDRKKFDHGLDTKTDQYHEGIRYAIQDRVLTVRKGRFVPKYTKPGGKKVDTLAEGTKIRTAYIADIDGKEWVLDHDGYWYNRSGFTPKVVMPLPLK